MAHGHVFGFRSRHWDCLLSFTIPGNDTSSKKEAVPSDWLSIVQVASLATVCVPYYTEFIILFLLIDDLHGPYPILYQVWSFLSSIIGLVWQFDGVLLVDLNYDDSIALWQMRYRGKFHNLDIWAYLLVIDIRSDPLVGDLLLGLEQEWSLLWLWELLHDVMSSFRILGGLVYTLFDWSWGYFSFGLSPIWWSSWFFLDLSY